MAHTATQRSLKDRSRRRLSRLRRCTTVLIVDDADSRREEVPKCGFSVTDDNSAVSGSLAAALHWCCWLAALHTRTQRGFIVVGFPHKRQNKIENFDASSGEEVDLSRQGIPFGPVSCHKIPFTLCLTMASQVDLSRQGIRCGHGRHKIPFTLCRIAYATIALH